MAGNLKALFPPRSAGPDSRIVLGFDIMTMATGSLASLDKSLQATGNVSVFEV